MMGIPSIVIGIFVYAIFVKPFYGFSTLSGSIALAIIMIPLVTRTAEEMILLVPHELREIIGEDGPGTGMSIGIATREVGSDEPIDSLMRRADRAMYEVKRAGRGHWRVAGPDTA